MRQIYACFFARVAKRFSLTTERMLVVPTSDAQMVPAIGPGAVEVSLNLYLSVIHRSEVA